MALPDLISLGGPDGEPVSHIRAAMLATALTLAALHAIVLATAYHPGLHQVRLELDDSASSVPSGPSHRLEVAVNESLRLDGVPQADLIALRRGLGLITVDPNAGLELQVHPELRYEAFVEILTVANRAGVRRLRVTTELSLTRCWPEFSC